MIDRLRALTAKWREKTEGYTAWDDAADELDALLAEPAPIEQHDLPEGTAEEGEAKMTPARLAETGERR